MNAHKYAGIAHALQNMLALRHTRRIIKTYMMSTTTKMTNESRIPRPKNAGPALPVPKLESKRRQTLLSNSCSAVRDARKNVDVRREPDEKHLIQFRISSILRKDGVDAK